MTESLKLSQPRSPLMDVDAAHAKTAIRLVCSKTVASVEQAYWLRRKREELAMAAISSCEEARLAHLDLAGRCMVKAAENCLQGGPAHIEIVQSKSPGSVSDLNRRFSKFPERRVNDVSESAGKLVTTPHQPREKLGFRRQPIQFEA